jgi:hypothetical protein
MSIMEVTEFENGDGRTDGPTQFTNNVNKEKPQHIFGIIIITIT